MRKPSELNLSNSITLIRIAALPLCAYFLFKNGGHDSTWRIVSWWLFFIVGMTDFIDGKLARSRGSVTELGKLLDPIADKALVGTAMIGLSILGDMPWWITVVILTREIGITIVRLMVISGGVIAANRGGKIKTMMTSFGVGFYVLPLNESLFIYRDFFMYIGVVVTLATGASYLLALRKR